MNNNQILERLLQGAKVEWKTLGEVCLIKTGKYVSKEMIMKNPGEYPVINSGREPLGYINQWNVDNDPLGVTTRGAGVGTITWQEGKYFRGNLNYSVTIKENNVNLRFLYHILHFFQKEIHKLCTFTGIPALNSSELNKLLIPIPPLSVQQEIAQILDKMTALNKELNKELNLRQKQYVYYRDILLNFNENSSRGGVNSLFGVFDVEWKMLGEVGKLIRGNGLQKKVFTEVGVPAIHYGQIYTHYKNFADKTISFVSEKTAERLKKAQYGDVLISGVSENVEEVMTPLGWLGGNIVFSGDMFAFRPSNELNTKYLTYLLQSDRFQKFKEKNAYGTKVMRIKADVFLKYLIPIPPLSIQQKIVAILDKFDTLTQSITEGLPKEIELRNKQYEYYRDCLFLFNK